MVRKLILPILAIICIAASLAAGCGVRKEIPEETPAPTPELLVIENVRTEYVELREPVFIEVPVIVEKIEYVTVKETVTEYVKQYVEVPCGTVGRTSRYAGIELSAWDEELLARHAWREARGEGILGMRMVIEVVLNRVLSPHFPNTVEEVLYQPGQFTPYGGALELEDITPTEAQYEAVSLALSETPVTDEDVVFFATTPLYGEIFMHVGGHYFTHYPTNW